MADQGIFSGTSFLVTILMAHMLLPEEFGVYASIVMFIYLVISLLNAIVIQPLQVSLARVKNHKSYISFSFWLQVVFLILFAGISVFILSLNLQFLEIYNPIMWPILTFMCSMVFHDYFRKLFLARAQTQFALIIDMLSAISYLVVITISYLGDNIHLSDILTMFALGYLPGIIWGSTKITPGKISVADLHEYISMHYSQSKWLVMTSMVQWWSTNLFVVASGVFIGLKALGAFRLVQSVFGVFNMLLQTFENYILPQTSRLMVSSQKEAGTYLKNISLKSSLLVGIILLGTFVFAKPIIILAGGTQYSEFYYVVQGMSVLYGLIFLGYPVRLAIRALVLNKHFFIAYLFSLVISLSTFNILLDKLELTGAIIGLIISQLVLIIYWQSILIKRNFILWK